MTMPVHPDDRDPQPEPVDLSKGTKPTDAPFDPYRFGRPDHPVPPEYAPPGYLPAGYAPSGTGPGYPPYSGPASSGAQPTQWPPAFSGGSAPGSPTPGSPTLGGPTFGGPGTGAPTPPAYHQYQQPGPGNGKAIAALVLGIASILLCWLSVFDAVFVVPALIFAIITLNETKAGRPRAGAGGRGMAVAGLACAVVGALLATVLTVAYLRAINDCGGLTHTSGSSEFQQCIQHNV